jgi:uncharacterized membrane protein HdeD (DUF308 family)
MRDPSEPIERFATVLQGRGAVALVSGVAALAWPDELMLRAMVFTSLVLAVSGVYEMAFAYLNRRLNRGWPLGLVDGAACFGMAVISATLTAIPFHATMLLASLWLFACGGLALALALAVWPMRRTRWAMLAWSGVQLALATVAMFDANADLDTLLHVGAAYTIGFGLFQIVAARWMRSVALPQFEPTLPHRWLAMGRRGLLAFAAVAVAPALGAQQPGAATHASHGLLQIPASIRAEHAEIQQVLEAATKEPGSVGLAARDLAAVLHPHFVREEQIALPPLGLLAPLARGERNQAMRAVLPIADSLRAELPRMLREHRAIHAATVHLGEVARAQGNAPVERLAEKLLLHARNEEEVTYPAALLVGDLVRAQVPPAGAPR